MNWGLATLLLAAALAALAMIDIRTGRLPDVLTLPLVALGIGVTALLEPDQLSFHAAAAALGYTSLWLIATLYRRHRGHDGLGLGDAKLLAAAGAWLGPLALAPLVLVASLSALATIGLLRLAGRPVSLQSSLPFGPFLGAGFLFLWCLRMAGGQGL
jgi:leader peptidase (prepilin peptidase)/N-methyltransferase